MIFLGDRELIIKHKIWRLVNFYNVKNKKINIEIIF